MEMLRRVWYPQRGIYSYLDLPDNNVTLCRSAVSEAPTTNAVCLFLRIQETHKTIAATTPRHCNKCFQMGTTITVLSYQNCNT